MKIESTAPTAAAVSSAQPAVRMAASNHSPWRSRAPHHPTLHRPLSTFPHPRVSGLSPQCFHFDCHSQTPPSLPLTLSLSHSLQYVSLLASRAALGRAGRGSHKLLPAAGSDSLTGPAAVFSEPCRHAATCRSRLLHA